MYSDVTAAAACIMSASATAVTLAATEGRSRAYLASRRIAGSWHADATSRGLNAKSSLSAADNGYTNTTYARSHGSGETAGAGSSVETPSGLFKPRSELTTLKRWISNNVGTFFRWRIDVSLFFERMIIVLGYFRLRALNAFPSVSAYRLSLGHFHADTVKMRARTTKEMMRFSRGKLKWQLWSTRELSMVISCTLPCNRCATVYNV